MVKTINVSNIENDQIPHEISINIRNISYNNYVTVLNTIGLCISTKCGILSCIERIKSYLKSKSHIKEN